MAPHREQTFPRGRSPDMRAAVGTPRGEQRLGTAERDAENLPLVAVQVPYLLARRRVEEPDLLVPARDGQDLAVRGEVQGVDLRLAWQDEQHIAGFRVAE